MFQRAAVMMASDDDSQWREAQDKYLIPLKNRFPDGKHIDKVNEWNDRVEMVHADSRITAYKSKGRELKSETGRIYIEGSRYEEFGDRVSALETYKSMVDLFKDAEGEDRSYVLLAKRQIALIESNADKSLDRVKIIKDILDQADKDYREGRVIQARKTWDSVWLLYGDKREFDALTKRARQRKSGIFDDEETPVKDEKPEGKPPSSAGEEPPATEEPVEDDIDPEAAAKAEAERQRRIEEALSAEEAARKNALGEEAQGKE